jgi:cytochrome c oxidase cbb3-type subunit I
MSALTKIPAQKATEPPFDAVLRPSLLMLFGGAICWLPAACFLALVAGTKLVWPGFLDGILWLSFGRIAPAALNLFVYGWALPVAFGTALWLLARLGRSAFGPPLLLIASAIFWNVGVLLGLCGILAGLSQPFPLLEFPAFASALLFIAYLGMGLSGYVSFRARRVRPIFASTWYVLAALLWFPWIYISGNVLLVWQPVPGPAQTPIAAWYAGAMLNLVLAPVILAVVYYLVPHLLGRRLPSYNLSLLGFWTFAVFGAWMGLARLVGGPVPAWLVSAGVVSAVLAIVPVMIISINLLGAVRDAPPTGDPVWIFVLTCVGLFLSVYIEGAFLAMPAVSGIFQFTDVTLAHGILMLAGFISVGLFAAIYTIVPSLTGTPWRGNEMISWHFWLCVLGMSGAVVCLTLGGLLQGFAQNDANVDFMASITYVTPFRFLALLGALSFFAGTNCLAFTFFRTVIGWPSRS